MQEVRNRFSWKGKYVYIISFVIPVLVFLSYMYAGGLAPFGDNSLLLGDAHAQMYPFLLEMHRKVHSGDFFFYSWSMGMGTNYWAGMIYYLMSPFNWLLMLLPEGMLEVGLSLSIVFRIALCAVTAVFYFMHSDVLKNFRYQKEFSLLFGMFYGLSSAVLCYFYLAMWLDIYYLFPLLLWALERLLQNKTWKCYYCFLVLVIYSNFYMAVPVCMFLIVWFLLHVDSKRLKRQFIQFAATSLLAGMTAAVCLLPVLYAIYNKKHIYTAYYYWVVENFFDVINHLLPMTEIDFVGNNFDTYNVYCGCICLFFALYYVLFSKDERRKRIKYFVFLTVMLFSLNSHLLSFVWHGFSLPHGYEKRFAYMVVFVLVYVSCMGLKSAMEATKRQAVIWIGLCIVIFMAALFFNSDMGTPVTYIVSMFVIAIAAMTVYLHSKKSIAAKAYIMLFLIMGMIEITANAGYNLTCLMKENWRNITDYNNMQGIYGKEKSETGRVVNDGIIIHNAGSAFGANAGDVFSSLLDADILDFYKHLGLYYMRSGAAYCYFGTTPFTDLLFNVEKKLTKNQGMYNGEELKRLNGLPFLKKSIVKPVYDDTELRKKSEYLVVGGENAVGYGFVSNGSATDLMFENENAFENQNQLFHALGGAGQIFETVDLDSMETKDQLLFVKRRDANTFDYANSVISDLNGKAFEAVDYEFVTTVENFMILMRGVMTMRYTAAEDMEDLYLYVSNTLGSGMSVKLDNKAVGEFNSVYYNLTIHVGEVKKGQVVEVSTSNGLSAVNKGTLQIYAGDFKKDALISFCNEIQDTSLHIEKMNGSGLKGKFTAGKDGYLYVSAVDDGGFTAYIDGKKTRHEMLAGCMVWIPVTAGNHTVELRYCPPGFRSGLVISLLSWCCAAVLWNWDKIKRKRQA